MTKQAPPARRYPPDRAEVIGPVADVLCDRSGRIGLLSYRVPRGMAVRPGDAVLVPFGKRSAYGMVVRPGNPQKATRDIEDVVGKRAAPADIKLASSIAKYHFATPESVYARLAPTSGRGAEPLIDRDMEADTATDTLARSLPDQPGRRLLVRAPLIAAAQLAAAAGARIAAGGGQVLILAPTVDLVEEIVAHFPRGARRLDAKADRGAWRGFIQGDVAIGVGTRAAALYAAPRLTGIVVAEEDHPGHVEARQPHTNARDVASARSRALRISLTLTSATPTPQAVGACQDVLPVGGRSAWPRMRLIDRGQQDPSSRWFPEPLRRALAAARKSGATPVVVAPTSRAVRRCARCGHEISCASCTSSLCRHEQEAPCPKCAAVAGVRITGWDTERVSDRLGDTAHVIAIAELAAVHDAGLVVLLDVDAALVAADYVPGARAAGLIAAAAAAAGANGTLLALTDDPDHPLLKDLFGPRDQVAAARRAYLAARDAGLPPFRRAVTVRMKRATMPDTSAWPGTIHGPHRTGDDWEFVVLIDQSELLNLASHVARARHSGKARITVT